MNWKAREERGEEILRLTKNLWQEEQRKRRFHLLIASQPHAATIKLQTMSVDFTCYQLARTSSVMTVLPTLLQAEFCADHQLLCSQGHSCAFLQSLLLLPINNTARNEAAKKNLHYEVSFSGAKHHNDPYITGETFQLIIVRKRAWVKIG